MGGAGFVGCMVWEEKDGQGGFREAYFLRTVTRWNMSLQDSERMRREGTDKPHDHTRARRAGKAACPWFWKELLPSGGTNPLPPAVSFPCAHWDVEDGCSGWRITHTTNSSVGVSLGCCCRSPGTQVLCVASPHLPHLFQLSSGGLRIHFIVFL